MQSCFKSKAYLAVFIFCEELFFNWSFMHDWSRHSILSPVVRKIHYSNSIFLRLTAELAGKYALIVIFVCLCVGM